MNEDKVLTALVADDKTENKVEPKKRPRRRLGRRLGAINYMMSDTNITAPLTLRFPR